MTSLLSLLVIFATTPSTTAKVGAEIFVRASSNVSIERLAAAVRPMGKIEERVRGQRNFLIRLNPGVDDEKAKQRLEKIPGVRALEPREEPFDMNSVRSVDRKLAHLRAEESGAEHDKAGEHESADYLGAYGYFYGLRAFPNDTFDWSSIERAKKHAHQMPATHFSGARPGANGSSTFQPWEFIGPTNMTVPPGAIDSGPGIVNGRINAVAYDPKNTQTIYAGAAQGGLWKSTNGGANWNWMSASWTTLGVNCIAVDPVNTDVIYVGLGDYHGQIGGSAGLMKTSDGGQTWTEITTASIGDFGIVSILIDPTNDNIVVAGAGNPSGGGGLYVSTNAGQSWTLKSGGPGTSTTFPSVVPTVVSNGNIRFYAMIGGLYGTTGGESRLLSSDDHGNSWQTVSACPVRDNSSFVKAFSVATSPTYPNKVYVLDPAGHKLYVSNDSGMTWSDLGDTLPIGNTQDLNFSQNSFDYCLVCGNQLIGSVSTDMLFLGMVDLQESLDQGQTWQSVGGPVWLTAAQGAVTHSDQHCLTLCPGDPNRFMFSNDGGVYQILYDSNAQSNSITGLNGTLGNSMVHKIACHPTIPNWIIGGTQDNSTPIVTSDLTHWNSWAAGDGTGVAINQTNPAVAYATSEFNRVYRMGNGISSETDISPTIAKTERTPFAVALTLDPQNQSILYTGTNFLYKWDDDAQAWNPDLGGTDLTNGTGAISVITVAPTDSLRVYTGSSDGALFWTGDGGNTWNSIQPPAMVAITSISVNPANENDIIVGFSNIGNQHLYRNTNAAAVGFAAWTSAAGSGSTALPDASLNAIARDLDDPVNTWYVATDVGIFQTSNAGASWTNAGTAYGLPNVIVEDLVAVPGTRYLNAGTYGRGVWRLYLPEGGANLVSLTISPNPVLGGKSTVGTITLSKPAPAGGTAIAISSSSGLKCPSSIDVAQGSTSANFGIVASPTTSMFLADVTATQAGISKTVFLEVDPLALQPLVLQPSTVFGGVSASGEVVLNGPAPAGGVKVSLSSSAATVKVPASVTIEAGATSANFTITTALTATTFTSNITAKSGGVTQSATLTVQTATLQGVSLSTSSVVGGSDVLVTGTVTFNGPTPAGGLVVKLGSSNAKAATVPASILVKLDALQRSASFTVTHLPVTYSQGLVISATCGGQLYSADLQVNPFQIESIAANPSSFAGGSKSVGTVVLNAKPGPKAGAQIVHLLKSQNVIGVPLDCSIPLGSTTGTFNITSSIVAANTLATITGSLGTSSQQTTVTIEAPVLESISVKPTSVVGSSGATVTGGILLTGPAPAGGIVVQLTSSNPTVVRLPASVAVPAGKSSVTFKVAHTKVAQAVTVTLTATYGGTEKTASLSVEK